MSGGVAQPAIPAWVQPGQAALRSAEPGGCLLNCFLFIYDLFNGFI